MVKLRSKMENVNNSAVLSDTTNVSNNKIAKKSVKPLKPAKKIVSKSLTAKETSAMKSPTLRSKSVIATSEEVENDENLFSNLNIKKDVHCFKKPTSSKPIITTKLATTKLMVATTPHVIKEVFPSTKGKRKQTKNDESANMKLESKIVPVSKSTKTRIGSKPVISILKNGVPNCYGFEDSDLENDQSPCKTELSKFDPSKPFRLALYVKPSRTIRINPAVARRIQSFHPSLNLTNYSMLDNTVTANVMSPNRTQFKVPMSSTPLPIKKTAAKLVQRKITDVIQASPMRTRVGNADRQFISYFEKSLTSDEEASPSAQEVTRKRASDDLSCNSSQEDIDDCTIPIAAYKKSRRSYIKKSRPPPEAVDEPPSDEVMKSVEKVKKKGKSKSKKAVREDEEFEKWSQSMNSMFSEVDQFEMSFG